MVFHIIPSKAAGARIQGEEKRIKLLQGGRELQLLIFYTRITFSITIWGSSSNSSNNDILLLQIINRGCLSSKILYEILCYYPVFYHIYMIIIYDRYQLKYSPIIIFSFNSTSFFFTTKKKSKNHTFGYIL